MPVTRTVRATTVALSAALLMAARAPHASAQAPARAPLTLRALLDSVRTHPRVRAAEARVRATRGARISAGAFANPMLALEVQGAQMPGGSPSVMERETMATATLPLEPLYQRAPRVRRAEADVRAAQAEARIVGQQVELDAAHAYYRTALAQVSLEVAQGVASWLDSVVAYNRARVREGAAAEADLIRSQLERDRAVADAAMQAAELARARAALGAFLGDSAAATAVSGGSLVVAEARSPLGMPGAAVTTSPAVMAARERLNAAKAATSVERAMIVHDVGVTLGTMTSAGATSLVAGLSVPFPLFDRNRGEIVRAGAERDVASYELAAEERGAAAEVTGAREAARVLTERAEQLAGGDSSGTPLWLARAGEARRIALGAYREGAVPLVTVLDAARAWAEARVTYHQLIYAQHESVLALLAAEGREPAEALDAAVGGEP